ncbi:MAG TPA: hypothetical protein GX703_04765 [Erysipelothrix sp.]|jgi:hypothetical protein|nr:hypothetical protein [Erysipelothrix sp.]
MKKNRSSIITSALMLIMSYFVVRYALFEQHGMIQWTNFMAILAVVVLVIAALVDKKNTIMFASYGYILSFVLGLVFNTESVDQGGGTLNNHWQIWLVTYAAIVLFGVYLDFRKPRIK